MLRYRCTKLCWHPYNDNDMKNWPRSADTVVTRFVGSKSGLRNYKSTISKVENHLGNAFSICNIYLKNCNLPRWYGLVITLNGPFGAVRVPWRMTAKLQPIITNPCITSAIMAVRSPPCEKTTCIHDDMLHVLVHIHIIAIINYNIRNL